MGFIGVILLGIITTPPVNAVERLFGRVPAWGFGWREILVASLGWLLSIVASGVLASIFCWIPFPVESDATAPRRRRVTELMR